MIAKSACKSSNYRTDGRYIELVHGVDHDFNGKETTQCLAIFGMGRFEGLIYMGVSENSVPLKPMVLLIIIPIKLAIIGNIPNIFRQTHIIKLCNQWDTQHFLTSKRSSQPIQVMSIWLWVKTCQNPDTRIVP